MAEFDEVFLARLRRHDERAFCELVLAYERQIYRLVWRMLGNATEAEDMTQEVFVQVFKNLASFRGDSKLSTWIYRIAVNLTKNRTAYLRRRFQSAHGELDGTGDRTPGTLAYGLTVGETTRPDLDFMGSEAERVVVECLHQLESEYREVLVLRDIEGMSYVEIQAITDVAEGTVKSRIHRGRSELKRLVGERLGEKVS